MYGACFMICCGVLFAPYVTLVQLLVLMFCVLTVEEYQKKEGDQRPAISQRKVRHVWCDISRKIAFKKYIRQG